MTSQQLIRELNVPSDTKMLLIVADGLGVAATRKGWSDRTRSGEDGDFDR